MSASIPDPRRDPQYHRTADVLAIRESVLALVEVVLPRAVLVFGGHPAISPLIVFSARRLRALDRVRIFLSEHFRKVVPKDSLVFPQIVWTPDQDGDREASLEVMRQLMFDAVRFSGGVFIGGMEGIEDEFALFRAMQPRAPVYPVASTGGAALELWHALPPRALGARTRRQLNEQLTYARLFRDLPGIGR